MLFHEEHASHQPAFLDISGMNNILTSFEYHINFTFLVWIVRYFLQLNPVVPRHLLDSGVVLPRPLQGSPCLQL